MTSAKIVIAGGFGVGKTTAVGAISEIPPIRTESWMTAAATQIDKLDPGTEKTTTTVAMDFGRVTVDDSLVLYLFGTPGQPRFWPMWDDLVRGAVGALVLVDTRNLESSFPAVNYFENDAQVPWLVCVNLFDGVTLHRLADVRAALSLPAHIPLIATDVRHRRNVAQALLAVVDHAYAKAAPGPDSSYQEVQFA
ncbi:ATP/GTP-binding protein [Paractinoplanes ferrugineus]|uniref:ATP/GTP-binding protein n=1 Tax=Paractinoplanes ferrugineus TaxID=113564 RepID=A0A919IYW4_9ACTN|nr:ATP/GTP-binding protein [Actinoplanes ferrugineus]GIE10679.1 ATP/GTP-binding protein [Actinoplanes ferrugineus]